MSLLKSLWNDETGSILSAELVLLGTLGVVGATVGIKTAATAINAEMHELAFAFRSLNQSYSYTGFKSAYACTAGSAFVQQDVNVSLAQLQAYEDACIVEQEKCLEEHSVEEVKVPAKKKAVSNKKIEVEVKKKKKKKDKN